MTSTPASSAQSQARLYASQVVCWGRIWTPILIFAMLSPCAVSPTGSHDADGSSLVEMTASGGSACAQQGSRRRATPGAKFVLPARQRLDGMDVSKVVFHGIALGFVVRVHAGRLHGRRHAQEPTHTAFHYCEDRDDPIRMALTPRLLTVLLQHSEPVL